MTTNGVDYSWSRPGGAALAAAGAVLLPRPVRLEALHRALTEPPPTGADDGVCAAGDRAEAAFQREATRLGLAAREIGMVTGLNYTRGRFLTLQLYRVAEAPPR